MMRSLVTAHTYAVQFAVSSTAATASRVTVRRLRIAASSTGQRRRSVMMAASTTVAHRIRQPISSNGSKSASCFQ